MARKRKDSDPSKELRRARAKVNKDRWEIPFLTMFKTKYPHLPIPVRDFRHIPGRKFAIDWAWEGKKLGVELHGGGGRGRHTTLTGHKTDCDKQNLGIINGWRVLQFNILHMKDMGSVVDMVAEVLSDQQIWRQP